MSHNNIPLFYQLTIVFALYNCITADFDNKLKAVATGDTSIVLVNCQLSYPVHGIKYILVHYMNFHEHFLAALLQRIGQPGEFNAAL
jgi:hypothetical protein